MTFDEQINADLNCLKHYFEKLFKLLNETIEEERKIPMVAQDINAPYDPEAPISHFIKPDMLINLYSLLDYWLERLCEHKKESLQLNLGWKDIKGNSDLHVYHKYLTKCAKMNLESLQPEYQRIDNLRTIRNIFIHKGGHPNEQNQTKVNEIKGITLNLETIVIHDDFIWSSLDNIRKYLLRVAKY